MVVAVVFLGSLAGLMAFIGAMLAGQPLWLALALYPGAGMTVALILGLLAALRPAQQGGCDQADASDWGLLPTGGGLAARLSPQALAHQGLAGAAFPTAALQPSGLRGHGVAGRPG